MWESNPSRTDMEKSRGDFQTLYQRYEPHTPELRLATHFNPDNFNNDIPSEAEVESGVRCLLPHRAGGHTHLHVEHFKQW